MPAKSSLIGAAAFQRKLGRWSSDVQKAAAAGAVEWGERTMAVSKDGGEGYGGPIVPVGDTGNLMGSGHVPKITKRGDKLTVKLVYGGPAREYAAAVHELREANFRRPRSGPGYLREPVRHMAAKIPEILGPHIKEVLK
jgi:hypothetical protein